MAFAPISTYAAPHGDGSCQGRFVEKDEGNLFEYSKNWSSVDDFPHLVWVGDGDQYRYARVLKTVAYVAVDEDENGFVVEKWSIKQHKEYEL
jgi:hypothetical protein